MMDAQQARAAATSVLEELERDIGVPLAIWDDNPQVDPVADHGDVWVVSWNSVEYLESGDFTKQQLFGPIAIPKDGRDWFILGTALPVEEELAEWRAAVGRTSPS